MMRRPSQYLPAGFRKNVSPLGGGAWPKAEDSPPVSELESPKLKTAGKAQGADAAASWSSSELMRIDAMGGSI
ncbi:hypothetical protein GW17_00007992 [Ensete ventricosum]|nr:hypothetical protein GW17_00007992 [Ensete ventricosum]RZR98629.1 hypothetical protein BHM03_00028011 [Ensete ventricosum]